MGFFHKTLSKYFKNIINNHYVPENFSVIEPLFHAYYDWSWYKKVCQTHIIINNRQLPYDLVCSKNGDWIEPTKKCFISNIQYCIESLKEINAFDNDLLDNLMKSIIKIYHESWRRKLLKRVLQIEKCKIDMHI